MPTAVRQLDIGNSASSSPADTSSFDQQKMKPYFLLVLLVAIPLRAEWILEKGSWSTPRAHAAFLLGMGAGKATLREGAADIFLAVAKLYAREIGVSPQKLTTKEWQADVAKALEAEERKDSLEFSAGLNTVVDAARITAFLAGAHIRWGTPTGFRSSGRMSGYPIAERITALGGYRVQLTSNPGYPGNTIITVSDDGGDEPSEDFVQLMHRVETEVRQSSN
jgi:hypothetical protein